MPPARNIFSTNFNHFELNDEVGTMNDENI